MKRERRAEIIKKTTLWVADVVENLIALDGGLYEDLAENDLQEEMVAVETVRKIADVIRNRVRTRC